MPSSRLRPKSMLLFSLRETFPISPPLASLSSIPGVENELYFGDRHQRKGSEKSEKRRHLRVIRSIDRPRLHNPFAVAEHAVDSPMNEHPKLCVLEPGARFQILRSRRVAVLRGLRVGGLRSRKRRE